MTVKIDFVRKPKRSGSFEDNGNSGGNLDSENEYWYSMNFNFHVPKKKKKKKRSKFDFRNNEGLFFCSEQKRKCGDSKS
jgi:hypothetical protein